MASVTVGDKWEHATLYGEIGARAFSELAAENSSLKFMVISKRAYRAGVMTGPKGGAASTPTSSTKTMGSGASTTYGGSRYVGGRSPQYSTNDILTVQWRDEVLMVQMQRYSKKGNLVVRVIGGGRTIVVPRQDVLCQGTGEDVEGWDNHDWYGGDV